MPEPIRVDIWSDVVCPWCYIGTSRFAEGIRRYLDSGGSLPVQIRYRAFELAPDVPVDFDGTEIDYLVHMKGVDADRAQRMLDGIADLARAEGLPIDFTTVRPARTLKAHELIALAAGSNGQESVVHAVMRAHFAEGLDIGNVHVLAELADAQGLDPNDVLSQLEHGTFAQAVATDIAEARDFGVDGVPYYLIDDDIEIFGAQDPDVFARALASAERQRND